MNNVKRKEIEKITAELEDIKERIEALQKEEQGAFYNWKKSSQYSERGYKKKRVICCLEYAANNIQDCLYNLSDALMK